MPTPSTRGAVLALGLLLTACGAGPRDDAAGGALDADVDELTATLTLEIGEAEGEAAYLFGRVFGLALDGDGRIEWYGPDGELAHTIRQPGVTGPPVSPEEARQAEERIAAQLEGVGAAPGDARFRVPERKPPLAGLFFDRAGRLWVRRSVAQGQPSEADVYTPDGALVARVTWPARIRLDDGFVDIDRALGTTTDSLGVVRVARLEFLPTREVSGH